MASVWAYPKTDPMWRLPLTVGGGVSIEKISARDFVRSNRKVPSASHRFDHLASSPSRAGFSGTAMDRHGTYAVSATSTRLRPARFAVSSAPSASESIAASVEPWLGSATPNDDVNGGVALPDGERQLLAEALDGGRRRRGVAVGEHAEAATSLGVADGAHGVEDAHGVAEHVHRDADRGACAAGSAAQLRAGVQLLAVGDDERLAAPHGDAVPR